MSPRNIVRLPAQPAVVAPRDNSRGTGYQTGRWEPLTTGIDRIPTTNARAATFGVVALVLAGTLFATGWYRDVRAAVPFTRDNLRAWLSPPPPQEQPRAATAETGADLGSARPQ